MDGTLANSLADLAGSTNFALKKFGFEPQDTEKYKYFAGDGMAKMIERALPESCDKAKTAAEIMPVFLDYYGKHYCDNTTAYPGVPELIDRLKERGIFTAVITNKAQEMAQRVVCSLYGDRFDLIAGKREGVPLKPDPALAQSAMKRFGVMPEECIFVGDSRTDVLTGINCKAYPVGVLWGFREKDELLCAGAKAIIGKPQELLAIIDSLS